MKEILGETITNTRQLPLSNPNISQAPELRGRVSTAQVRASKNYDALKEVIERAADMRHKTMSQAREVGQRLW